MPTWIRNIIFRSLYLNNQQGCMTTVAACLCDDSEALYLQPYWMPSLSSPSSSLPPPFMEMLGPYVGYAVTQPRLPPNNGAEAAAALWKVSEELTGHTYDTKLD